MADQVLETWVDAKFHAHEVPSRVKLALETKYRGQKFNGISQQVMLFFNEEAVLVQKTTITTSPHRLAQVRTKLTLKADPNAFRDYASGQINATRCLFFSVSCLPINTSHILSDRVEC